MNRALMWSSTIARAQRVVTCLRAFLFGGLSVLIVIVSFRHLLIFWWYTGHTRHKLMPFGLLANLHLHLVELLTILESFLVKTDSGLEFLGGAP